MFERRLTLKTLSKLARERGKARATHIPVSFKPQVRRVNVAILRLLVCAGIGAGCAYLPSESASALMGYLGFVVLLFQWNRVALDSSIPPPFFSLYPASAERIWTFRFQRFGLISLWIPAGALAIIFAQTINHQTSVRLGLASIPSALAFGASMIVLPLLLVICIRSPVPRQLAFLVMVLGGLPLLILPKNAPILFAAYLRSVAAFFWFIPAEWFNHFTRSALDPAARLFIGVAALGCGAALIKPLATVLERRVIRREEGADVTDSAASLRGAPPDESSEAQDWIPQPDEVPMGQARALLDEWEWGVALEPQTSLERFFWRTLNARQRLVSKLIWPLGFHWNHSQFAFFKTAVGTLALAGVLRLLSFTGPAWGTLALGSINLVAFAPIFPGFSFVFQSLYLSGRCAARCQFFPVSITEISSILLRCQAIRAAVACWIGAAYGALAWLIMGQPVKIGVSAGVFLIFLSFGFCPFALIWKLGSLTRNCGRRWTSIPSDLLVAATVLFGLIGIITAIVIMYMLALEPPKTLCLVPLLLGFAVVWRLIGRGILKLYLIMIERSWLDAVVKLHQQHRSLILSESK